MASQYYLLYQEIVINKIHQFFSENDSGEYRVEEKVSQKEYHLLLSDTTENLNKKKGFGILKIYFVKGKTSFLIQGNPLFTTKLERCRDYIISETELTNIQKENKTAVFYNVSHDQFNDLVEYVESEKNLRVKRHGGDFKVIDRISIEGPFQTSVTITYYHTGTVMVQGLITSLLIGLYDLCVQLFDSDVADDSSFLALLNTPAPAVISESLDDHFPDRSKFNGTPYEKMILSSLKLINSSICIPDFSLMSTGILRALEGMIGKRLHEVRIFNDKELIGARFNIDSGTGHWTLNAEMKGGMSSLALVRVLEDGYNFYRAHRHTTFHCDIENPMATIVYRDKEQALGIIEDSIKLIRRLINNW